MAIETELTIQVEASLAFFLSIHFVPLVTFPLGVLVNCEDRVC